MSSSVLKLSKGGKKKNRCANWEIKNIFRKGITKVLSPLDLNPPTTVYLLLT